MEEKGLPAQNIRVLKIMMIVMLGIVIVLNAVSAVNKVRLDSECTEETVCTVTEVEVHRTSKNGGKYTVRFAYTVDGEEYEFKDRTSAKYKAGDEVTLYYDPDDPSDAYVDVSPKKTLYVEGMLITVSAGLLVFVMIAKFGHNDDMNLWQKWVGKKTRKNWYEE